MKRARIREINQVVDLAIEHAMNCGVALTEANAEKLVRSAARRLHVRLSKRLREVCCDVAGFRYERRHSERRRVA